MVSVDPRSAAALAAALAKLRDQQIFGDDEAPLELDLPGGTAPQRVPVDPALQSATRVLAANDPDALQIASGVGEVPERPAAAVRSFLEAKGLPVGDDPTRIDDPVTRQSLELALGKEATQGVFDGELDIELLLGLIEAQRANERRPAPAPARRPSTSPTRGLSGAAEGGVNQAAPVYDPNWVAKPGDITPEDLQKIVPGLSMERAREVAQNLNPAMAEAQINTPERKAQFIAQLAHESGGFRYNEEIASGAAYNGRADLGNTQPGDGERFKGRGYIQITGRHNYTAAGEALGLDLVNNPELASRPENASRIAAWYWTSRNINAAADTGDLTRVTRLINGGTNGIADRQHYYEQARQVLMA